jgi:hypothetical protein
LVDGPRKGYVYRLVNILQRLVSVLLC